MTIIRTAKILLNVETDAKFPDISFYQDDDSTPQGVDFVKMREKTEFVIIRAGQNTWKDTDFEDNWKNAKAEGLARGSYWYYDSRSAPMAQAELWRDALDGDLGELPLWADYEENYGGQYSGWENFKKFLECLKELFPGKDIGIYTGYYYWRDNTPQSDPAELAYFIQYPVWLARYSIYEPKVPAPFTEWTFWQYTDHGDGYAYGVESKGIDLNYFNGTEEEMRERFGIAETEPPVIEPDPPTNGDDMSIEDVILILGDKIGEPLGRIADALEVFGDIAPPIVQPPVVQPPVSEYPKTWRLVPQDNGIVPMLREPNTQADDAKCKINPMEGAAIKEVFPPKRVYGTSGTLVWETDADLENVLREWACVPLDQSVMNIGGVSKMLYEYDDEATKTHEFGDNGFIQRKFLR